ncbi:hypothetical protein V1478_005403 [Vespula squamosa]|uniref:Uncharacterized protein n=1 Tax=Vespula squamosa TaxID=30214 RepID=A0ABD2BE80_VESSQ
MVSRRSLKTIDKSNSIIFEVVEEKCRILLLRGTCTIDNDRVRALTLATGGVDQWPQPHPALLPFLFVIGISSSYQPNNNNIDNYDNKNDNSFDESFSFDQGSIEADKRNHDKKETLDDDVYCASGQSGAASSRQGPTVLGDRGGNDPQGQTRSVEKEEAGGRRNYKLRKGPRERIDELLVRRWYWSREGDGDGEGPKELGKEERKRKRSCFEMRSLANDRLLLAAGESFLQMVSLFLLHSFLPESRLAFSVEFKGRASQYFGKFFKWTIRESKIGNEVGAGGKGKTRLDIRRIKPATAERPTTAVYLEN